MKKIMLLIAVLLAGCDPLPPSPPHTPLVIPNEQTKSRFEVTCVSIFQDDLAYRDKRGIYIIRDTETGREYVGVSGIGVTEIQQNDDVAFEE